MASVMMAKRVQSALSPRTIDVDKVMQFERGNEEEADLDESMGSEIIYESPKISVIEQV